MSFDRHARSSMLEIYMAGAVMLAVTAALSMPFLMADRLIVEVPAVSTTPHPPLVKDSVLSQTIPPQLIASEPAMLPGTMSCFSIMFATYARTNSSEIQVSLESNAGEKRRWSFNASDLTDNAYRPFCLKKTDILEGGRIIVISRSGSADNSPTVWLTKDARLGLLNGPLGANQGLAMRAKIERRMVNSPARLFEARGGAGILIAFCTALISIALIGFVGMGGNVDAGYKYKAHSSRE